VKPAVRLTAAPSLPITVLMRGKESDPKQICKQQPLPLCRYCLLQKIAF
jgi:hypothetical protein